MDKAHLAHYFDDLNVDVMLKAYKRTGWPLFVNGDYNINLFSIRTENNDANRFNDVIGLLFKIDGKWVLKKYQATVDPGYYWREHLMNPDGTGILVRGYYRGGWRIGMHKGQYRALVQNKPVKLYRDKNRDLVLDRDPSTIQEGMFGVNIHKAGANSTQVDKWSAACSVIQSLDQWNDFMKWIDKSAAKYGPVFSRAAFDESDVFPFPK